MDPREGAVELVSADATPAQEAIRAFGVAAVNGREKSRSPSGKRLCCLVSPKNNQTIMLMITPVMSSWVCRAAALAAKACSFSIICTISVARSVFDPSTSISS